MQQKQDYKASDLIEMIEMRNFADIRSCFNNSESADISECLQECSIKYSIPLLRMVPKEKRAEVFSYLPIETQKELLESLPDIVVESILNKMEPVDRNHLLEDLPEEVRVNKIAMLDPDERSMAWKLLSYPEDSVGRIMSPEFLAIDKDITVRDALADLRWRSAKIRETLLHHILVVDCNGELQGHLNLATLVTCDPDTLKVSELADSIPYSISALDDEGVAVDYFRKYDRPYVPVVNEHNLLVGIVEADDIFDVAEEEATEDIQSFGGQASLEDSYLQTPIHVLLRKRGSWLAMIFLLMMFTANVLQVYEASFEMKFILIFLPLIISSGGNSGSQAASLIIRGLAVKDITLNDWKKVFKREAIIGLGLGLLLGLLGFVRVVFLGDHGLLAGSVIGASLIAVVIFGALVGSMLPFMLKALKLDPAVSSSPAIASLVDIFGIFMLFNIAIQFAKILG